MSIPSAVQSFSKTEWYFYKKKLKMCFFTYRCYFFAHNCISTENVLSGTMKYWLLLKLLRCKRIQYPSSQNCLTIPANGLFPCITWWEMSKLFKNTKINQTDTSYYWFWSNLYMDNYKEPHNSDLSIFVLKAWKIKGNIRMLLEELWIYYQHPFSPSRFLYEDISLWSL